MSQCEMAMQHGLPIPSHKTHTPAQTSNGIINDSTLTASTLCCRYTSPLDKHYLVSLWHHLQVFELLSFYTLVMWACHQQCCKCDSDHHRTTLVQTIKPIYSLENILIYSILNLAQSTKYTVFQKRNASFNFVITYVNLTDFNHFITVTRNVWQ